MRETAVGLIERSSNGFHAEREARARLRERKPRPEATNLIGGRPRSGLWACPSHSAW